MTDSAMLRRQERGLSLTKASKSTAKNNNKDQQAAVTRTPRPQFRHSPSVPTVPTVGLASGSVSPGQTQAALPAPGGEGAAARGDVSLLLIKYSFFPRCHRAGSLPGSGLTRGPPRQGGRGRQLPRASPPVFRTSHGLSLTSPLITEHLLSAAINTPLPACLV